MKAVRNITLGALLLMLVCGCQINPPLFLRQTLDLDVDLALDLNVDVIWQVDWQARWVYDWNVEAYGELGYLEPESVRMHSYARGADGEPVSHQIYNFKGTNGSVQAVVGVYDFLFHNNDSETVLFDTEANPFDVYAYTRVISPGLQVSTPVKSLSQKLADTKAETEMTAAGDPVVLAPDPLFSLFAPDQYITDNPTDYEIIDGRYVIRVRGILQPANFIYLVQIRLLNNHGRVLGSPSGCALTGMAAGVDLRNNLSSAATVSVPADVHMNRASDPDLMGVRLISFGIPGCNAYDAASVAAAPAGTHFLVLSVVYDNGSYKNIHVDVTDQVRALPTGGVINLEIDVDDFPPDEGHPADGGGFDALLRDWDEEVGGVTIIY